MNDQTSKNYEDLKQTLIDLTERIAKIEGKFEGATDWNQRLKSLEDDTGILNQRLTKRKIWISAITAALLIIFGWEAFDIPRKLADQALDLAKAEIKKEAGRVVKEEIANVEIQRIIIENIPKNVLTEMKTHQAKILVASTLSQEFSEKARKAYEALELKTNESGELVFPKRVVFDEGINPSRIVLGNGGVVISENEYGGSIVLQNSRKKNSIKLETTNKFDGRVRIFDANGTIKKGKELY